MLACFGLDGKNTKTAGVGGMQGLNEKKLRIAEVGVHFRGLARTGEIGRMGLPCLIHLIKSECAVAPHCANGECGVTHLGGRVTEA